jgi:hypothetical protein
MPTSDSFVALLNDPGFKFFLDLFQEEFLIGENFKTKQQTYTSVKETIETYNM